MVGITRHCHTVRQSLWAGRGLAVAVADHVAWPRLVIAAEAASTCRFVEKGTLDSTWSCHEFRSWPRSCCAAGPAPDRRPRQDRLGWLSLARRAVRPPRSCCMSSSCTACAITAGRILPLTWVYTWLGGRGYYGPAACSAVVPHLACAETAVALGRRRSWPFAVSLASIWLEIALSPGRCKPYPCASPTRWGGLVTAGP